VFGPSDSGLPPPTQLACGTAVSPTPSLLSPNLIEALTGLAAVEDLPVATLIAVLINEALDQRLRSRS
jgi:hypothetical protein